MLGAIASPKLKNSLFVATSLWLGASFVHPTPVANFNFHHFSSYDGMTISISRSSPPLAILEDERLAPVRTEPVNEPLLNKNATFISSGTHAAWPRLARYAKYYARYHAQLLAKLNAKNLAHRKSLALAASTLTKKAIQTRSYKPLSKVGRLTSLIQFIPTPRPIQSYSTVRDHVEAPLTAPTVSRGLPRGEDAAPVLVEAAARPQARTLGATAPLPHIWAAADEAPRHPDGLAPSPVAAYGTSLIAANVLSQLHDRGPSVMGVQGLNRQPPLLPQQPGRTSQNVVADHTNQKTLNPLKTDSVAYQAQDLAQNLSENHSTRRPLTQSSLTAQNPTPNLDSGGDIFQITGEVELGGGVAITGTSTKLDIQWKSGSQSRLAQVDYSSGQFKVNVPTLKLGKVIAQLKDDAGRILGRGEFDLDEEEPGFNQNLITGVKLLVQAEQTIIKGKALSAYSVDDIVVPVEGAELYGPSSTRDLADHQGNFALSGLSSDSTFLLDGYAPDHWGTRVLASGNRRMRVPLFSNKMIQSFLDIVGASAGQSDLGIIWGEVRHKNKSVGGVAVTLSTTDAVGPIYFNELRIPDRHLTSTSTNGLYAFVKVKPGLHVVMAEHNKVELPSTVVSVSPSMVSYSELSYKSITAHGHVVDGIAMQPVPAQVSVVGASQTARSTAEGFSVKVPSSDAVVFIEANAGNDYYVSRQAIQRNEAKNVNLPVYKKDWVKRELARADIKNAINKGLVIGVVKGPAFHVQLDETSEPQVATDAANQNVYYFNEKGQVDLSLIDGLPGAGAFVLTNLNPGLHTLTMTSADGEITTSRLLVSEAGVVNVVNIALRP